MSLFSRFFGGRAQGEGGGEAGKEVEEDSPESTPDIEIEIDDDKAEIDARFAEWNEEEARKAVDPGPPVIISRVVSIERAEDPPVVVPPSPPSNTMFGNKPQPQPIWADHVDPVRLPGRPDIARVAAERAASTKADARDPMATLVDAVPRGATAEQPVRVTREWELTPLVPDARSEAVTPFVPDAAERAPSTPSPRSGSVPPPVSAAARASPTDPDIPAQAAERPAEARSFPPAEAGTDVSIPAPPLASPFAADPGSGEVWSDASFDDVLADLDAGFGAILEGKKRRSAPPTAGSPAFADALRLFAELVSSHMRHVRDFILDLTYGPATADWLALCIPASSSLKAGARQFELLDLEAGIDAFVAALQACAASGAPSVEGAFRDEILRGWGRMAEALPDAFKLDREKQAREGIIVKALLEQVDGVQKVQQDRLFAAGLMALDVLFQARAKDISDTTGLPLELTTRIVERFDRYREEVSRIEIDDSRRGEYGRLAQTLQDLARYHETYETASQQGQVREKKAARKHREIAVLDLKIMLARLGEAHALDSIERAPFSGKITHVKDLLAEKERELGQKL